MATLHELITKVIPLKGILRIPSYWMRKVLMAIADAVEAVDAKLVSVSDKLAHKDDSLTKAILYAKTGEPFFVLDKGTKMIIDGKVIDAEPYTVYKAKSLTFRNDNFSATSVDFLISLNIPAIRFTYCSSLTPLDLSSFDTSAVTNMDSMFRGCSGLTSLDLSSFNTSAVTNMYAMFNGCSGLTSLDISNFDTSAVTNMNLVQHMFYNCTALKNIKCKQAFKDWCVANASTISLTVSNITWEIVE